MLTKETNNAIIIYKDKERTEEMNKIYNNLNVENLVKTNSFNKLTTEEKKALLKNSQWFNQFNEFQQKNILKGLEDNLDISIYAKPEFDEFQMTQLRLGLEKNLDVSIYAKLEYNGAQIEQIRLGLEKDLDISLYDKKEYEHIQMKEIRLGLEDNLDVSIYAKTKFTWFKMEGIRKNLLKKRKKKTNKILKVFIKNHKKILTNENNNAIIYI